VTPTSEYEDNPTVTVKNYLANPTKSYRTKSELLLSYKLNKWMGHSAEQLKQKNEQSVTSKTYGD
jgi:rifampin ADP-ribosylating transferase